MLATGSVAAVATTALPTTVGSGTVNYLSAGNTATTGAIAANTLKISTAGTVSGTGILTITAASATSLGGILFDNSGGAGGLSGFTGITASDVAGSEVILYVGGSTPANAFTVASPITKQTTNTVALTKSGTGTLVLSGNNTYTGNTVINEGTVKLSGATANLLGTISVAGNVTYLRQLGTLDLNGAGISAAPYAGATSLPTVTIGALTGAGSTSPVVAAQTTTTASATNSTTISVTSASGIALGQTVLGLTAVNGSPNSGTAVVTGISGTTITLSNPLTLASGANLNFVANVTSGATVTNSGSTAAALAIGLAGTTTSTGIYTGLIQNGGAALSVIKNGTGTESLLGMNTYTGATVITAGTLAVTNLASGGMPSSIGASTNAAANLVLNGGTLQYIGQSASFVQLTQTPSIAIDRLFTLAASSTIASDGVFGNMYLVAGSANNAALVFANTGAITFGSGVATPRTLTLQGGSAGDNEIALQLLDNGSTLAPLGLTKTGSGLWILSNNSNSYTGFTTVNQGTLRVTRNLGSLPANSPLILSGSVGTSVLETSGSFTRSLGAVGPNVVQFGATGTVGFAASDSKLTVNLGGASTQLVWNSTTNFLTTGTLSLSSSTALAEVDFQNPLNLNAGARTISVNDNSSTTTDFATVSGVISGAAGSSLTLSGGTLRLTNNNTYSGTTTVAATVVVTSIGLSTAGSIATSLGAANGGAVLLGSGGTTGTLVYVGAGETTDRLQLNGTTGGAVIEASGTGPLVITALANAVAGAKTLYLYGQSNELNTISANLADNGGALGIQKGNGGNAYGINAGVWLLMGNNTFTGSFKLYSGTVLAGSNTALGAGTLDVNSNNATLGTYDRDISLANPVVSTNGTLVFAGVYNLALTGGLTNSGNSYTFSNAVARGKTLTLAGTWNISEAAQNRSITFTGSGDTILNSTVGSTAGGNLVLNAPTGSLTLGGASPNTFTGGVTLTLGTLILAKVQALGTSAGTFAFNNGVLQINTDLSGANAIANPVTIGNTQGLGDIITGANSVTFANSFGTTAGSQVVTNNLSGGALLTFSGALNLNTATDATNRRFTIFGTGNTLLSGSIQPSRYVFSDFFDDNIGTLTVAPTAASGASGLFAVAAGTAVFANTNGIATTFANYTVYPGGTLKLDNTTANADARLGLGTTGFNSGYYSTTVSATGAYQQQLNLAGGTLNLIANAAGGSEKETYLNLANGGGSILFTNAGGNAASVTFAGLINTNQGGSATVSVAGGTLGTTDRILLGTAVTNLTGLLGNASLLQRIVVGSDFATYDQSAGITAFAAYSTVGSLDAAALTDTLKVSATNPTFTGKTSGMLTGTAGATSYGLGKTLNALALTGAGTNVGSSSLRQLTLTSGAVLATGSGETIGAKWLSYGGTEAMFHVLTGADLTVSSALTGSGGLTKADGGTLVLNGPLFLTGYVSVNGGTLKLGSAFVPTPGSAYPTAVTINVNNGTFDLNGNSLQVGDLSTARGYSGFSLLPTPGAIIDNTSASAATLIVGGANQNGNVTYAGLIQNTGGALSLNKQGSGTLTLMSPLTYTGSTTVGGGTLQLFHAASLASTSITLNFAQLTVDNSGNANNNNRLPDNATVTLNGGTLTYQGQPGSSSTETFGTLALGSGHDVVNVNIGSNGFAQMTAGNVTRAPGATVYFNANGQPGLGNSQFLMGALNGVAMTDGQLLPTWMVYSATDYAVYRTGGNPAMPAGLVPFGSSGAPAYVGQNITALNTPVTAGILASGNISNITGAATSSLLLASGLNVTGRLRIGGGFTIDVNFQSASDTLQLEQGGILRSNNANNTTWGATANQGVITAGTSASTGVTELVLYAHQGTETFNAAIKDTKDTVVGGTGTVSFTKGGGGNVTFGGTMTYTGGTVINTGTLTLAAGASMLGDITLNNANLTASAAQQFATNTNLVLAGTGTVTLVGSNTINSLVMVAMGLASNPQVTGGTSPVLKITGTTTYNGLTGGIVAWSDSSAGIPYISNVLPLDLNGSDLTVAVGGFSTQGLQLNVIQSGGTNGILGGAIIKTGPGVLELLSIATFTGGIKLNQGSLIFQSGTGAGTGTISIADGTAISSMVAVQTVANPYSVAGNFTVPGVAAVNGLTLSGAGTFAAGAHTVTVQSPLQALTLSGTVSSVGTSLTKDGLGILSFTGANVSFTQPITLSGGQITIDSTAANFSAPITASAGTVVNLNAAGVASLGVSQGAINISGAGELTKSTGNALTVGGSLTYTGATSILASTLTLAPTSTAVNPVFAGSSVINLQANGTAFILDNTAATGSFTVGNSATGVNFLARDVTVQSNRSANYNTTLNLGAVYRAPTATGIFNFVNSVSPVSALATTIYSTVDITNGITVAGSGAGVIDQGVFITTGTHTDFAYRNAAGNVVTANYGVAAATSFSTNAATLGTAGALKVTGSVAGQGTLGSASALSTLTLFGPNANLALATGQTVYVDGILRTGAGLNPYGQQLLGNPYFANVVSTVSGGTLSSGAAELIIRTDSTSLGDNSTYQALNLNSVVAGTSTGAGLTKVGTGYLTLGGSASNTYAGVTTLLGGTTILQKTGGTVAVPGNILLGDNTNVAIVLQFGNAYAAPGTYDNQTAASTVITLNANGSAPIIRLSGSSQTVAGVVNLGATSGIIENTSNNITPISPSYYASTLTINNTTDDSLGAGTTIRDGNNTVTQQFASLALVKTGGGKLVTGTMNHTGGTTVSAGELLFGANTTAPSTGTSGGTGFLSVASGAIVDLNNFAVRFDGLSGAGTVQNTSSGSTPTLTAPNFVVGNLDNTNMATGGVLASAKTTFGGVITDGFGTVGIFFEKVGHGTQTINSTVPQTFTKGLAVFGGGLVLDLSNMATPTNLVSPTYGSVGSIFDGAATTTTSTLNLSSSVGLAIGQGVTGTGIGTGAIITAVGNNTVTINQTLSVANGGTLLLTFTAAPVTLDGALSVIGKTSTVSSQAFTGVNVGLGASTITVTPGSSSTATLALGALGRPLNTYAFPGINAAGTPATNAITAYANNFGVVDFGTTGTITTTTANVNGILGAYATVAGNDWAVGGGTIAAYAAYTSGLPTSAATATVNYVDTSTGVTLTAAESVNTLKLAPATTAATYALGANILTVAGSGILMSSASVAPATITGSTGSLQAGSIPGATDLIVFQNSTGANTLTISSIIANNATAALTQTSPAFSGVSVLTGLANTTNIYPGMVVTATGSGGTIAANTYVKSVDSGTQLTLSATITASTSTILNFAQANGLTKAGPGTLVLTGANTFTGQVAVLDGTLSINALAAAGTAQPLGKGSFATVLGGGANKTGVLQYTGASASTALTFYLGDGGFGEFQINNATAQTLTVSSLITGGGGLNVSSVGAGTGSVLLSSASNNYLGVTTVKAGALLKLGVATGTTTGALGAEGTAANGTVVQSGGQIDAAGFTFGQEVLTISGTGIGGTGAVISSAGTAVSNTFKNLILAANATVGSTLAGGQIGITNGFIQGNGNNLTFNLSGASGGYMWFISSVLDNVPTVTLANGNSSIVVQSMNFGSTVLTTTGATDVQLRMGTLGAVNLGVNAKFNAATAGDSYVNGPVILAATSTASTWQTVFNASLTINGNITGGTALAPTAIAEAITRQSGASSNANLTAGSGLMVFGGNANLFTGGLVLQGGTTKIMPLGGSGLVNPLAATNNLTFNAANGFAAYASAPYFDQLLVVDNSKTTGSLAQALNNLTVGSANIAGSLILNNATGANLSLVFNGAFTRTAGSELMLGAYTTPVGDSTIFGRTFATPNATTARIDLGAGFTTANATNFNAGVFIATANGTDYAFRDTSGASGFMRAVDYSAAGNNFVAAGSTTAALTNSGALNFTKVAGTVTAQGAGSPFVLIGPLTMAGTGSLTIDSASILVSAADNDVASGLLKNGGGSAVITGGTLMLGLGGPTEALVRVDTAADALTIASALTFSGSVKLFKLGQGRLILSGNNSFTVGAGGIVVGEGILQAASSTAFGDATNTVTQIWGTAVEISGGITLVNPMQIGLTGYDSTGWMNQVTGSVRNVSGNNTLTGALTSSGYNRINSDAGTLTLTNDNIGADQTIGGLAPVLGTAAGNVVITSLGSGTGYNFSHDGTGTLTLQLSSSSALTGKTLGSFGGALVLDFTNMTVTTNMFLATEILSLRGSQFQVVGKATGNTAQTFATFTVADGISRLSVNSNGGAGTTLTLGAFAAPSGYGTVDFLPSLNAVFNATAGGAAVNQNGILGSSATNFGFATAGNDWAAYSSPSIVAFNAYTGALPATGSLATGNYTLVASQTVTATQPANSLKIFPSTPVTLTANTGVQLNTSAFLIAGATGNDVTLAGAGTFGSTTLTDYFHLQGANNLIISAALADNSGTTNTGIIFAGTGTGGVQLTSTGIINLTANTTYLYFEGGLPGAPRQVSNAGSITKASAGNFDIAHTGTDSVVFTNTGVISVTGGNFYVGSYAGAYGKYVQSGASSSFNSTVPVAFSYNSATVNNGGASYGTSAFDLQGGSFSVGPNTFLVFGNAGSFAGTQSGGNLLVVRPNAPAFFLGEEGSGGGAFSYAQSSGTFTVVGTSVVGGRTGATASYAISGGTASFQQGLILGLQDFAQGTFTQTGGTVSVGTGVNISDSNYLKGNNVIGLSLAFNQTLSNGNPAITKGTYNLLGGTLQANDITTGQGNGYLGGANAAANTFTESSLTFTTTSGGTALFNWGAGTLQPFDNELTIGAGVQVALTAAGATLNTNDKDGVGRTVTFNTPISGGYGLTVTGNGLLMLNSAVSYAGDTTVSTGTLRQGMANVLASGAGAGNLALPSGATKAGTFDLNGANAAINGLSGDSTSAVTGQVVNNAAGAATLTVGNNNATSTFNGVLKDNNNAGTGTLALTKTGSGTLTLGGANTYTGATTVSAGKLAVNGSLAAGSTVAVAAGATLAGSGRINGAVTAADGAILTAGAAGSANMNLAGGLTLTGTATLNTSALALGQGTGAAFFTVGALTTSGAAGSVTLNVTSGSNYTNGATYSLLTYTGGSIGGTGTSAFTQGTIFGLTGRQSASIDFSTVGQINIVIGGVSPVWSGYDSTGLVRSTAWTEQALNGWTTTNWYTGSAGSPTVTGVSASDAVLFDDTALTVGATLGGTNPVGAIVVDITGADVTPSAVTFNNSVANYVLQGSNGITGSTSLIKNGTGTLTINNANSFTGGVNLNAGAIIVGNAAALGAVTNTVAFGAASNAFLSLNNTSVTLGGLTGDATATVRNGGSSANAVLTLGGAATSNFAGALVDGAGSSLLGVTTAGTATLVLTGANTYTGGTTIGAGSTLQIGNNGTTGSIVGAVTDNGVLTFNRSNSVTYPGTVTGTGSVVAASGTLILTGSLNNSGTNSVTAGATLQVGDTATNGSLGNVTDAGTLAFANNGTAQTYAGTVTGGGAVNFTAGTLILTGALNNSGADTIAAGATLQIGNGTLSGTFASDVTVTGTLAFNPNGTTTYGNLASGAGNLSVLGGTVILSSGSSYLGATNIASGATLQIGSGGTTGSISASSAVTNNGTLIINRSGTAVFNNAIAGTGSLTVNGSATLTLGGASAFSGTTYIQRGTVKLASSTALGSTTASVVIGSAGQVGTLDLFGQSVSIGAVSAAGTVANQIITNSSTLTDSVLGLNTAAGDMTYAGKFTNSTKKLGLTVTGGNALILTGVASANTLTGVTAVRNGALKFGVSTAGLSVSQVVLGGNGTNGAVDVNGLGGSIGGLTLADASAVAANQFVGNSGSVAAALTLTVPAATTVVFNGVIKDTLGAGSSTTGLTIANNATGIQALTGNNTYTGATTINTGTLQIGAAGTAGSLGATAVTIGASGTLLYSRTDSTNFGSVTTITGAGAITVGTGYTLNTGTTDGIFNTTGALNLGVGTAATTVSSFAVNANATIGSLNTATNTASANTVTIATGKTLTTNAGLSLGYDAGAGTVPTKSNITVTGAGTFNVTGTTVNISKDLAAINSAWVSSAILDVTGLAAFTANVTTFNVGVGSTSSGQGTLLLSNTANTLLATTIDIADTGGNNGPGTTSSIVLGTGTNVIQVDTLQIGRGKSSGIGLFGFASQTSGSAGTLTLTNKAGSGGASISVGDAAGVSTAGNAVGTLDLRGHVVNVTAATLNIGKNDNPSLAGSTSGTVNFDTGTFTANAVTIAAKTAAGTGAAIGVLNISGGTFTVTSGGTFTLGSQATAGTSQATLNLTGGTLTSNAAILNGGGSTTAVLNLNGGTLDLVGNTIGSATASVTLTLAAGTLKNVAQINNGAAITKTTAGTLILDGTNTYAGATTISAGTLQIGAGGATGTLGAGNIVDNGALAFNRSGSLAVTNAISGTGTVSFAGGGTFTLSGANSYAGATTIAGATVVAGTGALSATPSFALTGGTLTAADAKSGATLSLDASSSASFSVAGLTLGAVTNANSTTANALNFTANSGTITLASLSGAGKTTFGSAATITTGGITGGTVTVIGTLTANVTGGTVVADSITGTVSGSANVTITGTASALTSGTVTLGDAAVTVTSITGGNVVLGTGALTVNTGTQTGVISGNTGSVIKAGGTELILQGSNTYSGSTTVAAGKLTVSSLGDGVAASSIGTSALTPGNLLLGAGTTLNYVGTGETSARGFTVDNSATLIAGGSGALAFSSAAQIAFSSSTPTRTLTLDGTNPGANTLGAVASGSPLDANKFNQIIKNGVGTWIIASAGIIKTTAEFDLNNGTLGLGAGVLSGTGKLVVAAGTTVRWESGNTDDYSAALHLAAGANATLNTGANNVSFANALTFDGGAAASVTKTGAGTLTLAASNSGVTGGFTLSAGGLNVTNATGLGSGATVVNGGSLSVNAVTNNAVTVNNGGNIGGNGTVSSLGISTGGHVGPGNSPGTLNVTGTTTLAGGSVFDWQVQDALDPAKYDHLNAGTLNLSGASISNRILFNVISLDGVIGGSTLGSPLNFSIHNQRTFNLGTIGTLNLGANANINDVFTIDVTQFSYTEGVGSYASLWSLNYDSGSGALTLTAVPEPSTYGFGLGALALAVAAVRRRRKTQPTKA